MFFQGVYLLTSIGLNITKHTPVLSGVDDCRRGRQRRPELRADSALRHRRRGVGQRGGLRRCRRRWRSLSQRFYPIQYETGRLARVAAAALVACLIARALPEMRPLIGILAQRLDGRRRDGARSSASPGSFARTKCARCDALRRRPGDDALVAGAVTPPRWPARSSATDVPDAAAGRIQRTPVSEPRRGCHHRRHLRARPGAASGRAAVRPAGCLQPRRSGDHGARVELREGHAEPAQLPLPDVLLLRPVRVGRRVSGVRLADRARRLARRTAEAVFHESRRASTPPAEHSASRRGTASDRCAVTGSATRFSTAAGRWRRRVFLAVAPLHVRDSHYVKHDVPATLAIIVAYLMMAGSGPRQPERRHRGTRDDAVDARRRGLRRGVLDALLLHLPRAAAAVDHWCRVGRRGAG